MIAIVVSRADAASEHVGDHLLDLREWATDRDEDRPAAAGGGRVHRTAAFELRTFEDLHLDLEGVAEAFDDPDALAFASRHSGETGPLLTAHFTGNFGPAEYGGRDGELTTAWPAGLDRVVAAFDEHAPAEYDVGVECTHHGPSAVGVPSLFVELGSGEDQWADPGGARAVARAILALGDLTTGDPEGERPPSADGPPVDPERRTLVGFGGGHYAPRFERVLRATDWTVGHVAADWALESMGPPGEHRDTLRRAFAASDAEHALLADDRPALRATLEDLGYRVVTETWVREVDGVPLALAERVEERLGSVEAGLRFGGLARGADEGVAVAVHDLPVDLLEAALGVDREATVDRVRERTLAVETAENGNRLAGRVALPAAADRGAVVDALVDVLAGEYEVVDRDEERLVVRTTSFDPNLAREAGVPEGPKFGRLAAGEPVTVDGETVSPEMVRVERVRRFDLGSFPEGDDETNV